MLTVVRWWTRYGLQLAGAGMLLGAAFLLRHVQGAAVVEAYAWLSRPFPSESPAAQGDGLAQARLLELEQRLGELERQNQQLQELLGHYQSQPQGAIAAPVIGRSPDGWWQQAVLGRGSQEGIARDFVVTGIGGLVGRVVEVTPHGSRVALISDPSSRVGVAISRSRSMGILIGQGSQLAALRFFEKVPDVRPGDAVATSAVSRKFPAGLPVGRVKSVDLEKGPAPEAVVELTAPIDRLEWAVVQPFKSQL